MVNFSRKIGIDLGTANVIVYEKGKGIVLNEPAIVALMIQDKKVLAVGKKAQKMLGRNPSNVSVIRPMKEGVIADFDVAEKMLSYFIREVCGSTLFSKPELMVCVPAGVNEVEKRAVLEAALQIGVKKTALIEEPVAAAIGAGLLINEPTGNMVIDIGGGTTDIAVLSLGGMVVSRCLKVGGDRFDDCVLRYIKTGHNLLIGERTAESIKVTIGDAMPKKEKKMKVTGRDLMTGLPRVIEVSSLDVHKAIEEPITLIIEAVKQVLEETPPELSSDIIDRGLVMSGGGSLLAGLGDLISEETGIPVFLADEPSTCVAIGTGKALENLIYLGKDLITHPIHKRSRKNRT